MKRFFLLSVCILSVLTGCNNEARRARKEAALEQARQDSIAAVEKAREEAKALEKKTKDAAVTLSRLPDEPLFDIETNLGTMRVKLYKKTPRHRENFAKLALAGYYDGLLFHRVENGILIQGGDPLTRDTSKVAEFGTGGPEYTIPSEIEACVKAGYTHKKGALAAARRPDVANPYKESSGSQFYLVVDPKICAALDGEYTVFGEIVSGMETLEKIASVKTSKRKLPLNPVKIITIKAEPTQLKKIEPEEGEDGKKSQKDKK